MLKLFKTLNNASTWAIVGLLVILAILFSITISDNSSLVSETAEQSLAAAVCSGGSCTDTSGPLTLTASPDTVYSGDPSMISWSVDSSAGTISCFGNNAGTCGSAFQSSLTGIYSAHVFTVGGVTYVVGRNGTTNFRVFRWMPAGTPTATANPNGCLGNGTTCGTNIQSVTVSGNSEDLTVGTIGSQVYLFFGALIGGTSANLTVYKWIPASNCFGNATTCGTALQNIPFGSATDIDFYSIGLDNFLMASRGYIEGFSSGANGMLFKWMPSCNSGQGGLGNGTTCGTQLQTIGTAAVSRASFFSTGGNHFLTIADKDNGAKLKTYRYMSTCNSNNGGFGNGTTCGSALQTINTASAYAQVSKTFYEETITDGTSWYALVSHKSDSNQTQKYIKLYKWIPASNCFGSGTTCGTHVQQINSSGLSSTVVYQGSTAYITLGGSLIYKLIPAQNCIGNGTTCASIWQTLSGTSETQDGYTIGTNVYLQHGSAIFKAVSTPPTCSVVWSTNNFSTTNPFATGASNPGLTTGSLIANRSYRLSCTGVTETATVPVTVAGLPTVTLQVTDSAAKESPISANTGTFTITRTSLGGATPYPALTVQATISGGAVNGIDYNTITLPISIGAGQPSASVTVTPRSDHIDDDGELVTLTLNSSSSYTLGATVSGSVIIDDPVTLCTLTDPSGDQIWTGLEGTFNRNLTSPVENGIYTLTCVNPEGTYTDTVNVQYQVENPTVLTPLTTCTGSTVASPTCSLGANPSRVRKNTQTTISWHVAALSPTASCNITATPAISGFNPTSPAGATSWINSLPATIPRITTFTLRCTEGTNTINTQKTVGVLPSYQEI